MEDNDVDVAVLKEQYAEILRRLTIIDDRVRDQNGRVRKLEEFRWKAAGVVATALLVLTVALKWVPSP